MKHLIIVASGGGTDSVFDDVWKVVGGGSPRYIARRCPQPDALCDIVQSVTADGPLDILDVVSHGHPGKIWLGTPVLFSSTDMVEDRLENYEIAARLAPLLADTAQVRLLGCNTARSSPAPKRRPILQPRAPRGCDDDSRSMTAGQLLLVKLAAELGGRRVVFGTIAAVNADRFTVGYGFAGELSDLYSSLAALDRGPVSDDERSSNIDRRLRRYPGFIPPGLPLRT